MCLVVCLSLLSSRFRPSPPPRLLGGDRDRDRDRDALFLSSPLAAPRGGGGTILPVSEVVEPPVSEAAGRSSFFSLSFLIFFHPPNRYVLLFPLLRKWCFSSFSSFPSLLLRLYFRIRFQFLFQRHQPASLLNLSLDRVQLLSQFRQPSLFAFRRSVKPSLFLPFFLLLLFFSSFFSSFLLFAISFSLRKISSFLFRCFSSRISRCNSRSNASCSSSFVVFPRYNGRLALRHLPPLSLATSCVSSSFPPLLKVFPLKPSSVVFFFFFSL